MQALLAVHGISPFGRQGRFGTIALVGVLHLGAIYTLLVSLDVLPSPIRPTPPVEWHFVQPKVKSVPPLPVPLDKTIVTRRLPVPTPLPPVVKWVTQGDKAISPEPPVKTNPGGETIPSGPTLPIRALASTHTIPPYPPLGVRLAHEGTTRLKIAVDTQGNVVSADVVQSSGHDELDIAAIAWVKAHWRYQPATRAGQAISGTTEAVVTFRLNQTHG